MLCCHTIDLHCMSLCQSSVNSALSCQQPQEVSQRAASDSCRLAVSSLPTSPLTSLYQCFVHSARQCLPTSSTKVLIEQCLTPVGLPPPSASPSPRWPRHSRQMANVTALHGGRTQQRAKQAPQPDPPVRFAVKTSPNPLGELSYNLFLAQPVCKVSFTSLSTCVVFPFKLSGRKRASRLGPLSSIPAWCLSQLA